MDERDPRRARRPDPLPIVWMAMVTSQLAIAAAALFLSPEDHAAAGLTLPLALAGLMPAAASLAVGRLVLPALPRQTVWILRWALAEASGLVGLVIAMTGGTRSIAAGLVGLGFVLILAQFPRDEVPGHRQG